MAELNYYIRHPSYQEVTKLINSQYEEIWDECLRADTTKEKLRCVRKLDNFWNVRKLFFKLKSYESSHLQLNLPGGTA